MIYQPPTPTASAAQTWLYAIDLRLIDNSKSFPQQLAALIALDIQQHPRYFQIQSEQLEAIKAVAIVHGKEVRHHLPNFLSDDQQQYLNHLASHLSTILLIYRSRAAISS